MFNRQRNRRRLGRIGLLVSLACAAGGLGGCMDAVVPADCYRSEPYQATWEVSAPRQAVLTAVEREVRATPDAEIVLKDDEHGLLTWREPAAKKWTDIRGQAGFAKPEKSDALYLTSVMVVPQAEQSQLTIKRVAIGKKSISIMGPQDGVAETDFVQRTLARLGLITYPPSPEPTP